MTMNKSDLRLLYFASRPELNSKNDKVSDKALNELHSFLPADIVRDLVRRANMKSSLKGMTDAVNGALEQAAHICRSCNDYDNPMTANDCAEMILALRFEENEEKSNKILYRGHNPSGDDYPKMWMDEFAGVAQNIRSREKP